MAHVSSDDGSQDSTQGIALELADIPTTTKGLHNIPVEILLHICFFLLEEPSVDPITHSMSKGFTDLSRFSQTCRQVYAVAHEMLYAADARRPASSALIYGALTDQSRVMQLALDAGAPLDALGIPLFLLPRHEHLMVDGFLGFYTRTRPRTVRVIAAAALHFAVMRDNHQAVQFLLDQGANPVLLSTSFRYQDSKHHYHIVDDVSLDILDGCPAWWASWYGRLSLLKMFTTRYERVPQQYLPYILQALRVREIDVAAFRGNHHLLDFIIGRPGSDSLPDHPTRSALAWACETWDNGETIRKLVRYGHGFFRDEVHSVVGRCLQAHHFRNVLHLLSAGLCGGPHGHNLRSETLVILSYIVSFYETPRGGDWVSGNRAYDLLGPILPPDAHQRRAQAASRDRRRLFRYLISRMPVRDISEPMVFATHPPKVSPLQMAVDYPDLWDEQTISSLLGRGASPTIASLPAIHYALHVLYLHNMPAYPKTGSDSLQPFADHEILRALFLVRPGATELQNPVYQGRDVFEALDGYIAEYFSYLEGIRTRPFSGIANEWMDEQAIARSLGRFIGYVVFLADLGKVHSIISEERAVGLVAHAKALRRALDEKMRQISRAKDALRHACGATGGE